MKKGHVATLDINVLLLKHSPNKFETFEDEIQYIIGHQKRNNFIKNLALDLKGNTLILFARVEGHGEPLYNLIQESNVLEQRQVFFVHGGVATEDREEVAQLQKWRVTQSLLPHTEPSQQESTLKIFIMSSLLPHLNLEYETFNQSEES